MDCEARVRLKTSTVSWGKIWETDSLSRKNIESISCDVDFTGSLEWSFSRDYRKIIFSFWHTTRHNKGKHIWKKRTRQTERAKMYRPIAFCAALACFAESVLGVDLISGYDKKKYLLTESPEDWAKVSTDCLDSVDLQQFSKSFTIFGGLEVQEFCVTNRGQFKFTISNDTNIFLNGYYDSAEDSSAKTLKIHGASIGADEISDIEDFYDNNGQSVDFTHAYIIQVTIKDLDGEKSVWQNLVVVDDSSEAYFITNIKVSV